MVATYLSAGRADDVLAVMVVDGYFGLGTNETDPTIECAGTDYARVAFTASTDVGAAANYTVAAVVVGRKQTSAVLVDFGTVGAGGWNTLYWLLVFDASTGGSPTMAAPLTAAQVTAAGNTITIPIGNMRFIAKGGTP
jgi:hypothetical protein